MKKPLQNIKLPEALAPVADAAEYLRRAREEELDVARAHIRDTDCSDMDMARLSMQETLLENCRFLGCDFSRAGFRNVRFCNCDFSNSKFHDAYFADCALIACKGIGAALPGVKWRRVTLQGCNLRYANFDKAGLEEVCIAATNCSGADFSSCKLKSLRLEESELVDTSFFCTPLKGVDFTTCRIGNLILSDSRYELEGAVVNAFQAAELAKLLGVTVV